MKVESEVRSYCRTFPDVFSRSRGSEVISKKGKRYLDFLSACGSLNYGHNHPDLKKALLAYIADDGIAVSMDMYTHSKEQFIDSFSSKILKPRKLKYRMQFTGPTGANSIEAALKLARKVTGRTNVIAFTNGFHGCSLGALSLTGNSHHRASSAAQLNNVSRMPYCGYLGEGIDTADMLGNMLSDPSSGVDAPAAIVLEVIQGEGGLNTASEPWIKKVESIARKNGALFIVDEIQSGCGRSGDFFAFESLGVTPDIVTLAKSLSGFGIPMSLVLINENIDRWQPGEHNGTFRGNNHAFVTAKAAIDLFWSDMGFSLDVHRKAETMRESLREISAPFQFKIKGRGMMQGIDVQSTEASREIIKSCFKKGLILEACGPSDQVIKLLPALTISDADLERGLAIIACAIREVCQRNSGVASMDKPISVGFQQNHGAMEDGYRNGYSGF